MNKSTFHFILLVQQGETSFFFFFNSSLELEGQLAMCSQTRKVKYTFGREQQEYHLKEHAL